MLCRIVVRCGMLCIITFSPVLHNSVASWKGDRVGARHYTWRMLEDGRRIGLDRGITSVCDDFFFFLNIRQYNVRPNAGSGIMAKPWSMII